MFKDYIDQKTGEYVKAFKLTKKNCHLLLNYNYYEYNYWKNKNGVKIEVLLNNDVQVNWGDYVEKDQNSGRLRIWSKEDFRKVHKKINLTEIKGTIKNKYFKEIKVFKKGKKFDFSKIKIDEDGELYMVCEVISLGKLSDYS